MKYLIQKLQAVSMFIYLVKAIACSGIFYSLYALLFNREKMLVFNRVYLLGSLIASFLIPLITVTIEVPIVAHQPIYVATNALINVQPAPANGVDFVAYINNSIITVMALISCYLLVRLLINFYKLRAVSKKSSRFYINRIKLVLLNEPVVPYSFLNTIYLSRIEYENGKIEREVMAHEMAHIRQKHSWDILFIELLKVVTWFNPFIYLYKRSVKINHELLADAAVVKQLGDVRGYQVVLLQRAAAQSTLALASSFTFYITKKRLTMLLKKPNKKRNLLVSMAVIPITTLVIAVGCNTEEKGDRHLNTADQKEVAGAENQVVGGVPKDTTSFVVISDQQQTIEDDGIKSRPPEPVIDVIKPAPPKIIRDMPEGAGASASELAAYEEIIRQTRVGHSNKYKWIEGKSDQLLPIYQKMTLEQRRKASELPPPPPPPPPPNPKNEKQAPPLLKTADEPVSEITPTKRLYEQMIAHAAQITEAYYAANASANEQ